MGSKEGVSVTLLLGIVTIVVDAFGSARYLRHPSTRKSIRYRVWLRP